MTATETEIREGCDAIDRTLDDQEALADVGEAVADARRVYLVGCGSSYWVGVLASNLLREAGVDATAVAASELLFGDYRLDGDTVVLTYSQSGETTETVRALQMAGEAGARTASITNTAGSTLATTADHAYVTEAGDEESVLATKSVDTAVTASYLVARAVDGGRGEVTWTAETCEAVTDLDLAAAVEAFRDAEHCYTIGTGVDHGLAGEAATKFGEGPLVHSTPMPAMEISHGPRANVDDDPVLLVVSDPTIAESYEPLIEELQDAGAAVVVLQPEGVDLAGDATIDVPTGEPQFLYALKAIQQLTLALALDRGLDPDDPPELTKHIERDVL